MEMTDRKRYEDIKRRKRNNQTITKTEQEWIDGFDAARFDPGYSQGGDYTDTYSSATPADYSGGGGDFGGGGADGSW
jgi:uncharacterized membrane protein YgcG